MNEVIAAAFLDELEKLAATADEEKDRSGIHPVDVLAAGSTVPFGAALVDDVSRLRKGLGPSRRADKLILTGAGMMIPKAVRDLKKWHEGRKKDKDS